MATISFSDIEGFALRYATDPKTKQPRLRVVLYTVNHLQVYELADGDATYLVSAGGIWPEDKEAQWTPISTDGLLALGIHRIEGIPFRAKKVLVCGDHACIDEVVGDGSVKHTCVKTGDFIRVQSEGKSYDGIVKSLDDVAFVIGWFDAHNRHQIDVFGWATSDIIVY